MLVRYARLLRGRLRRRALRADIIGHTAAQRLAGSLFRTRRRAGVTLALTLALVATLLVALDRLVVELVPPAPQPASAALVGALPGATLWNERASSLLFGTNDTYEWSDRNLENLPDAQGMLRSAHFTLVRTFIPDQADDATIERRVSTIERIGAHCLAVLTNIDNLAFNQHVVSLLGARCQLYEFGNEPDLNNISPDHYLARWNAAIPTLRRLNPGAKFIGPVTSTPEGKGDFLRQFLEGVSASKQLPDAISFHDYPCYNDDEADCLSKADSFLASTLSVRSLVKSALGHELPVGVSEWNYDPGNPPPSYGDKASFITQFTDTAVASLVAGGAVFAAQFDAASYSGYGRLDMFDVATGHAKPQYYAMAALIQRYRPSPASATAESPTPTRATSSALLSRDATVACSQNDSGPGEPNALHDGKFGDWGFWQVADADAPGWCALRLPAQAGSVELAWYSDYSFDYMDQAGLAPQDYDLAVSANSTNGADGAWRTVLSVRGNQARAREHLLPFAGMTWVKMILLTPQPHASQPYMRIDELEVFDAQRLGADSFFFSGDSITGMAYNRSADNLPAFANDLQGCAPARYPLTINGGFGGQSSQAAADNITTWLAQAPDVHYWLLGWGTNDAFEQVAPAAFRANLQRVISAIQSHGGTPVLARIPYTAKMEPGLVDEIQQLNRVIDELTTADGLIAGPDFYTLFSAHPTYLGPDALHPSAAGAVAMNALWFATLRSRLGLAGASCA